MRKWLLVLLAALMLCALSPVAALAQRTAPRIAGVNEDYWYDMSMSVLASVDGAPVEDLSSLSVVPGERLDIQLEQEAFLDSVGEVLDSSTVPEMSASVLSEGKLGVRSRIIAGGQAIDKVILSTDSSEGAAISILFQQDLVQTKELPFECTVFLTVQGKKVDATEIQVAGVIANPVFYVGEGESLIDLSDGSVAEATSYVKDVEVNLGDGVSLTANLYEGTRYYGIARAEVSEGGAPLVADAPEVQLAYTIKTINLKREGKDVVRFDLPERYFAYDSAGAYIGTTDQPLVYSAKYYLSTKDFDRIEVPEFS